jgi:transcriptional regulator with XRE-family HTH domain
MSEATSLRALIGERVRAARLAAGIPRQEDLADLMHSRGLTDWTTYTVTAVEVGRRLPDLAESAILCSALGITVEELLGGADHVRLDNGTEMPLWALRRGFEGSDEDEDGLLPLSRKISEGLEQALPLGAPAIRSAERKAAVKLGCPPAVIAQTARSLWGRTLSEERDRRVAERSPGVTAPEGLRARRGHVTRELMEELAPAIRAPKRRKRS